MRAEFFIAKENSDTVEIISGSGDNGRKKKVWTRGLKKMSFPT